MISIPRAQLDIMRAHVEAGYPNEACGLLIGEIGDADRRAELVVPTPNAWVASSDGEHDLRDRYLIAPEDYVRADREARKRDLEIIGFFHSHPDWPSQPSETDREMAWPVVSFFIASVRDGKMASLQAWILRDDRSAFDEEHIHIT